MAVTNLISFCSGKERKKDARNHPCSLFLCILIKEPDWFAARPPSLAAAGLLLGILLFRGCAISLQTVVHPGFLPAAFHCKVRMKPLLRSAFGWVVSMSQVQMNACWREIDPQAWLTAPWAETTLMSPKMCLLPLICRRQGGPKFASKGSGAESRLPAA